MTLAIEQLSVAVDGKPVVRDVSLTVDAGSFVSIVGHNGAGKTTLLRTIMGLWRPQAGSIVYDGTPITGWSTPRIVQRGVRLVPQLRGYFATLTVDENLDFPRRDGPIRREEVFELFPTLSERRAQVVGTMSGGERRMLAVALGLIANPRLLLLDEPSVGLQPNVVESMMLSISTANREFGVTIVLVEQNIKKVLETSGFVNVLNQGRVVYASPCEKADDDEIWRLL